MRIKYSRKFKKQYTKAPQKIKQAFKNRRNFFLKNPHNPVLNNHKLGGKLKGRRSINVSGDWRALYSEPTQGVVIFEALGTHSQLYKQ